MPTQNYKVVFDPSVVAQELLPYVKHWIAGKEHGVCGTTTPISRYKDSGGLLYWANQEGLEGRPIRGPESKVQKACDAGTLGHAFAEAFINGTPLPKKEDYEPDIWERGEQAGDQFLKWKNQTRMTPVMSEISLISPVWLFGGTLDAVTVDDELALLDFKTGGVYPDALIQVCGAYNHLWCYHYPNEKPKEFHIIRFPATGGFTHFCKGQIPEAWEIFKYYRVLYELDKIIKKAL